MNQVNQVNMSLAIQHAVNELVGTIEARYVDEYRADHLIEDALRGCLEWADEVEERGIVVEESRVVASTIRGTVDRIAEELNIPL